jgi:hypothetical protein
LTAFGRDTLEAFAGILINGEIVPKARFVVANLGALLATFAHYIAIYTLIATAQ